MRSNRILTDMFQGVERLSDESNRYIAVLYHGSFRVIIPMEEAVEPPRDYRGMEPESVLRYLVNKRLGAEVDYIVKGIDQKSGIVVASRLEAMRMKRKQYYFGTDWDGNNRLYEGVCAEARVVSVIRAGIFIDLFGLETYIPLSELSYQRMLDATQVYQPGQRVLVKITELDRSDRDHISVTASVKQAGESVRKGIPDVFRRQLLCRYGHGSRYDRRVCGAGRRHRLSVPLPEPGTPAERRTGDRSHPRRRPEIQPTLGRHHTQRRTEIAEGGQHEPF